MVNFRAILAGLIALAVAAAPVAAARVVTAGARAATAATSTAHDCDGKAQHHDKAPRHHSDKACCPYCQDQRRTKKCTGDGSKCCKLTGMVTVLPGVAAPLDAVILAANPQALIGWQGRPLPPPP